MVVGEAERRMIQAIEGRWRSNKVEPEDVRRLIEALHRNNQALARLQGLVRDIRDRARTLIDSLGAG